MESKTSRRASESQIRVLTPLGIARPAHTTSQLSLSATLINTCCSHSFGYTGTDQCDNSRRAFLQKVLEIVEDVELKYILVKKFDGGLEKVVSDGFERITSGKGSGKDRVHREFHSLQSDL